MSTLHPTSDFSRVYHSRRRGLGVGPSGPEGSSLRVHGGTVRETGFLWYSFDPKFLLEWPLFVEKQRAPPIDGT